MQRRAELGAVVAIGPRLVHDELDGRGLARIQADHHVRRRHREPVRRIGRPLRVGQVHDDPVADLGGDDVGREVAADDVHPHFDHTRAADDARVFLAGECVGALLVRGW